MKWFLTPLWKSFYSASFYEESSGGRVSRPVLFLLFLCAVCAALFAVKLHLSLVAAMKDELPFIVSQLPDMKISDGRFSTVLPAEHTAVAEPLYAVRTAKGELFAVIDETADIAPEGLGGAKLYVTGNEIIVSDGTGSERSYPLSCIRSFSLDQETIRGWALRAYYFAGIAFFPFLFLGLSVYRFIQAVILALFAFGLLRVMKRRRAFSFCFSLSLFSLIPPLTAGTLVDLMTGKGYVGFWVTILVSALIIAAVSRRMKAVS